MGVAHTRKGTPQRTCCTPGATKSQLGLTCLPACRSLGQNFLLDDDVLQRIVNTAGVQPGDLVLEIGPGACGADTWVYSSSICWGV